MLESSIFANFYSKHVTLHKIIAKLKIKPCLHFSIFATSTILKSKGTKQIYFYTQIKWFVSLSIIADGK